MRILEIETFGRGGLIHYAYNLSCALAERGHEITLVTSAAYELEDRGLPAGVRLVKTIGRITHRSAKAWPGLVRKIEAIVDACAVTALALRLRPDVIHIHCTNSISLVYHLLLRLLRIPFVATAHVVTPHEGIRFQRVIYGGIHRSCHLVIAHSDFDRQRLIEEFAVDPDHVVVIPHGEYGFFEASLGEASLGEDSLGEDDTGGDDTGGDDTGGDRAGEDRAGEDGAELADREKARRGLDLEPHGEVALFFGYIREYKGLDLLLEAWPMVLAARPEARLVIAGDPVRLSSARCAELQAWATRVGAIHRFDYIPFSDVAGYFAAADVLVMPYRHISQSGVLYLALSLGVPVVATRVGALPEMLRDGESAVLVPAESSAALARGLTRVLGDPELRGRLAQGGLRIAEEHSWPAIAKRTESAFANL